MIDALRTFPSRFASLAAANETLAPQCDHAPQLSGPIRPAMTACELRFPSATLYANSLNLLSLL
jgi:hypothetical protein